MAGRSPSKQPATVDTPLLSQQGDVRVELSAISLDEQHGQAAKGGAMSAPVAPEAQASPPAPGPKVTRFSMTEDAWGLTLSLIVFALTTPFSANGVDLATYQYSVFLAAAVGLALVIIIHRVLGKAQQHLEYCTVLFLAMVAHELGAISKLSHAGLGAAFWGLVLGALFAQFARRPTLSLSSEFFIKCGVVLLATPFSSIKDVGARGLLVAWVDTVILIVVGTTNGVAALKMTRDHATIVAVATSVCGSSAAAATAESLGVPKDDSTVKTVIAVMSLLSAPLIPILPQFKRYFSHYVMGGWIGGAVNSTGPVSATGAIAGDDILRVALVVKMAQNLLIVAVSLVLTLKKAHGKKSVRELAALVFLRFPKFVWGFLLTSVIVTAISSNKQHVYVNNTFAASEWISLMGFVVIGFELDVGKMMGSAKDMSVVKLYLLLQTINLFTTLGWSYIAFTYVP